ncbi:catalase [Silvimonas iriomotensis]|uniref:Catalase n=1 Tax=Silvimonas iriomotensis TaxID=449662 RepID=A0ABQ2P5Q3_9NEIS|nr:catalase [Silvimonas iriomotensis]GGP18893.1 catalase HPII [Silvimonas iriomotensis]
MATRPRKHADTRSASTLIQARDEQARAQEQLARNIPWNATKKAEYGAQARTPHQGETARAASALAHASTVTEATASPKTGDGKVSSGASPIAGALDRVRTDDTDQPLTTNQGTPVADNQSSLKAGLRGPTLMEDFILREKLTHFDHERIPERVVHARGSAAHGYFESYGDFSSLTRAAPLASAGKRTPVFVRFSTVAGERGSADTVRDVRGFAVKFYTDEGNWDLVGNNIPVFFIQDAMKFPDLIHAVKPEPNNGIPQAASAHDTFWDFASLSPETAHMLMWHTSDRAIPRSYRTMQGFGVHTFRLINQDGEAVFCKFHWQPLAGTHSLVWDEALRICGADPDYHRRDLWEAIESGEYPEWELALQVFTAEEAEQFEFDVLDPTKLVPEELAPLQIVGKMVLDRNPDNFFAETEQVAFCTAHIIPGIDFSNDPLLQGRIHSYVDTQISRLGGANFHELPINAPIAPVHNNQRDGIHRQALNRGRVAYEPNSLGGGCPFQTGQAGFASFPEAIHADKMRGKPEKFADHYSQARLFWRSQTDAEQNHIINAFCFELGHVQTPAIQTRVVSMLANINPRLASAVAQGLGIAVPEPMPLATDAPIPDFAPSPALSLRHLPGKTGIHTRKVAILQGEDADHQQLEQVLKTLHDKGAVTQIVTSRASPGSKAHATLPATVLSATSPVLYDGVIVAAGDAGANQLATDPLALEFARLQYRHGKPMLALGGGKDLFQAAQLPATLPDGGHDNAILVATNGQTDDLLTQFMRVLAMGRITGRERAPETA